MKSLKQFRNSQNNKILHTSEAIRIYVIGKLRLNSKSILQMHQPFVEYGVAGTLSPQDNENKSAQSTEIRSARGICYHQKIPAKTSENQGIFLFRARIVTLVTRAVALLVFKKTLQVNPSFTTASAMSFVNCPPTSSFLASLRYARRAAA